MSEVFTPRDKETNRRLRFDRKDVRIISGELGRRGLGLKAVVEIKGQQYKVYGASCSAPHCQCDAIINKI